MYTNLEFDMNEILNYENLNQDWWTFCSEENIPYQELPVVNKVNQYDWRSNWHNIIFKCNAMQRA